MASIVALECMVGVPGRPPIRVDWAAFEATLGLRLPDDYKSMFDVYRTLDFDQFITVFHPGSDAEKSRNDILATLESLGYMIEENGGLAEPATGGDMDRTVPFAVYPEPGGLLPWGETWNGDLCLWRTVGDDPQLWTIVITDHIFFWEYRGSLIDFLIGVMNRTIRCPMFPTDFPSSDRVHQVAD